MGKRADPVALLETIAAVDTQALRYELEKLHAIRAWALGQVGIDYGVGDRVTVVRDLFTNPGDGRHPYRECGQQGALAVVLDIDFAPTRNRWYADIQFEREWSVSTAFPSRVVTRYWNGPAAETPDGMKAPSEFDQQHYPEGRRHLFSVSVDALERYQGALCARIDENGGCGHPGGPSRRPRLRGRKVPCWCRTFVPAPDEEDADG